MNELKRQLTTTSATLVPILGSPSLTPPTSSNGVSKNDPNFDARRHIHGESADMHRDAPPTPPPSYPPSALFVIGSFHPQQGRHRLEPGTKITARRLHSRQLPPKRRVVGTSTLMFHLVGQHAGGKVSIRRAGDGHRKVGRHGTPMQYLWCRGCRRDP